MRVLHGELQRWHLLEDEGAYYLAADCGTSVGYRVAMRLQEHEVQQFLELGVSGIEKSARAIHAAPDAFFQWRLPEFANRPDVSSAISEWEATHAP